MARAYNYQSEYQIKRAEYGSLQGSRSHEDRSINRFIDWFNDNGGIFNWSALEQNAGIPKRSLYKHYSHSQYMSWDNWRRLFFSIGEPMLMLYLSDCISEWNERFPNLTWSDW